ncbi:MAG: tRNA pseudouridine(38-40) synthase TruA [Hyphomicrobiaceae bacterium]
MPRYRLTIEYDGTTFTGWQSQPGMPTVQGAIEAAFLRFTGETVFVRGAGRTDSGVHALGQVAHVDLKSARSALKIREALNFHLKPAPIAIITCEDAASDFDARFSATSRHYLYRILNRRAPPALDLDRVWSIPYALDAEAMHEAAQGILGQHDFTTFRASACQAKSPLRTLDQLDVRRVGDEIHVETSARAFLHNQVRSMVGSLKLVGQGKWRPRDLARALEARDRTACGVVAPPSGLYLVRVGYHLAGAAPIDPSTVDEADD